MGQVCWAEVDRNATFTSCGNGFGWVGCVRGRWKRIPVQLFITPEKIFLHVCKVVRQRCVILDLGQLVRFSAPRLCT